MNDTSSIHYLKNEEIDKTKWDQCIDKAGNGVVYAYSYYLDTMSKHWDALVWKDYEVVMPVTWNKKYSICYLYQPFLTAQLGIFGKNISEQLFEKFLEAMPRKFLYWDISLNQKNIFPETKIKFYLRNNFILNLNKSYDELYNNYNENTKRNIKKAEQANLISKKDIGLEKITALAWQQIKKITKQPSGNMDQFEKLYHHFYRQQQAMTYGIFSQQNELLASCAVFYSHNRIYYILVGNNSDGKPVGASHALIDSIIKDHAGKKMLFDFEGSDIPGLALFYSGFGSVEEKYPAIKLNKLPFYLKWMKK